MLGSLDKNSKIPYYLQLKELLKQNFNDGEFNPGDKLPSEAELCRIHRVSRTVVRQALLELEYEGLIYKVKGKGAYVSDPKMIIAINNFLSGLGGSLIRQGANVKNMVLACEIISADKDILENHSSIKEGEDVVHLERVRYINNEPMVVSNTYLPLTLCPDLVNMDLSRSLYDCLRESSGIQMAKSEITFEADKLNEKEAEIFNMAVGSPMLLITSKTFDIHSIQIEYAISVFRGDKSRISGAIFQEYNSSKNDSNNRFDIDNYLITNG